MWVTVADIIRIVVISAVLLLDREEYGGAAAVKTCSSYQSDPISCRQNNCTVTCADRSCVDKGTGGTGGTVKPGTGGTDKCSSATSTNVIITDPTNPTTEETKRINCPKHCFDVCACRRDKCEYDSAGGNCRPRPHNNECRDKFFPKGDCRRPNTIYIEGGLTCKSTVSDGNCEILETVLAVNLNGNETYESATGITFSADAVVPYLDPHNTRIAAKTSGKDFSLRGIPESEHELWVTYIKGKDGGLAQDGRCITYEIPIKEDGLYELIIKMAEFYYDEPNQRSFRVKFNKKDILEEIDLYQTIGDKDHTTDFVLKFEVQKKIYMEGKGFGGGTIENGKTELSFCYGSSQCKVPDMSYIVSAFAVVRYTGARPVNPPVGPETTCNMYHDSPCVCKMRGCEFNTATKTCHSGEKYCYRLQLNDNVCRKAGTFLVHGGVTCPIAKQAGNCNVEKLILAVNVNGVDYTDMDGVKYSADDPSRYEDPVQSRMVKNNDIPSEGQCFSGDAEFKDTAMLYYNIAAGMEEKSGPDTCLTYLIPLEREEGRYLITIKTMDWVQLVNSRRFNVKFNGVDVLPEFDIIKLNGRCKRVDLLINFRIIDGGTRMLINGHPSIDISSKSGSDPNHISRLSFCYGMCRDVDSGYWVSAFSFVKLESVNGAENCKSAVASSGNCKDTEFDKSECRRNNAFYIMGGVPCKSAKSAGNCEVLEQIRAVNLHGTDISDPASGIQYWADSEQKYKDPHGTRFPSRRDAVKGPLQELYATHITGVKKEGNDGKCIYYPMPISIDGDYELILKLAEFVHDAENLRRFKVKLNNVEIMPEIDLFKLIGAKDQPAELILKFKLANKVLTFRGSGTVTHVQNDKVELALCFGTCDIPDTSYMASGFAVVRYTGGPGPTECNTEGNCVDPPTDRAPDKCDELEAEKPRDQLKECYCRESYCQYRIDGAKCGNSTKFCIPALKFTKCHRAAGFVVVDGVICRMERSDNCEIEDPIIAININGKDHTDRNGISFRAEMESDFVLNYKSSRSIKSYDDTKKTCEPFQNKQVKQGDAEVYYTTGQGRPSDRNPENCMSYPIKITEDGEYELGMKFIELHHTAINAFFTIKLNDQVILSRFDIFVNVGKCQGMDVYVHFKVSGGGKTLNIAGKSKPSTIKDKKMSLTFCYGDPKTHCRPKGNDGDPNYVASAFYIAKFKNKTQARA